MGEAVNKLFPFINFIFRMGAGLSEVLPYGERQISVYFFQFEYKIELDIPFFFVWNRICGNVLFDVLVKKAI